MSSISYLGGLHKELHHVKVMRDGSETYEPALVILCHERKGRSFVIPIGAMWKYIDPSDNREDATIATDRQEFQQIVQRAMFRRRVAVTKPDAMRATADISCCVVAETTARGLGILLSTAWSLAKIAQMFDITPCPQAMAQLLLWVQNALDDLRGFPEHDQDDALGVAGEMILKEGSRTVATKDIPLTEADLLVPDEMTEH